jgi:hypothetical protein
MRPSFSCLPRIFLVSLLVALAMEAGAISAQENSEPTVTPQLLETSVLMILSGGETHSFTVELADEPKERRRGLMFRRSMEADHGMLFRHDRLQRSAMWMKNTYIPLDILFIQQDGVIVNIVRDTKPKSLTQITSKGRVLGVLELNAGITERLGIKPGDQVRHAIFGNAPD